MHKILTFPRFQTLTEEQQREHLSTAAESTLTQMISSAEDLRDLLGDIKNLTPEQINDVLGQIAYEPYSTYRTKSNFAKANGIQYPTHGNTVSS